MKGARGGARREAGWLLATVLTLSGCGDASLGERLSLRGTVRDAETGRGIEGAAVIFTSDTGLRRETMTGGGGSYAIARVADTPFGQLRVEAEGFRPREATVFFDTPQRVVDLELRPSVE